MRASSCQVSKLPQGCALQMEELQPYITKKCNTRDKKKFGRLSELNCSASDWSQCKEGVLLQSCSLKVLELIPDVLRSDVNGCGNTEQLPQGSQLSLGCSLASKLHLVQVVLRNVPMHGKIEQA